MRLKGAQTGSMPLRTAILAVACLLFTPAARAQDARVWAETLTETAADVRRQLASNDPKQVAWGAFRAAEHRIDVVPSLLRTLETPPAADRLERYAMIGAVLDAAAQLNARLPAEVLRSYYQGWPIQTLILFANATESRPVLLDLLKTASGDRWYALANLLLETQADGFAAELLTKIEFRVRVHVSDTSNGTGIYAANPSSVGVGDGIGANPPGFPPNAFYRFEAAPRRGFIVLSTGPRTIYYSRSLYYQAQYPTSYPFRSGPTDAERIEYVIQLVTFPTRNGIAVRPAQELTLQWRGSGDLVQQTSRLREDVVRRYEGLVSILLKEGRLSEAEGRALAQPRMNLEVIDERNDRSAPLPSITQ
jgi:hypothetical protein